MIYDWQDYTFYLHKNTDLIILVSGMVLIMGIGSFVAIILTQFE